MWRKADELAGTARALSPAVALQNQYIPPITIISSLCFSCGQFIEHEPGRSERCKGNNHTQQKLSNGRFIYFEFEARLSTYLFMFAQKELMKSHDEKKKVYW